MNIKYDLSEEEVSENTSPLLRSAFEKMYRINASFEELKKIQDAGQSTISPIFEKDGTILGILGGYTVARDVDDKRVIVFSPNPDNVRPTMTRVDANGEVELLDYEGLSTTENLIVIDAWDPKDVGVDRERILHSIQNHERLITGSASGFGVLRQTSETTWRHRGLEFETKPLTPMQRLAYGEDADKKVRLYCGFGQSTDIDSQLDKQPIMRALWKFRRKINRDMLIVDADEAEDVLKEYSNKISPLIMQGYNGHEVSFQDEYETRFAREIKYKFLDRYSAFMEKHYPDEDVSPLAYLGFEALSKLKLAGKALASGVVTTAFSLANGVAVTFNDGAKKNTIGALPKILMQFARTRAFMVGPLLPIFAIFFATKTVQDAKMLKQKWRIWEPDNISRDFYKEKKNPTIVTRRYQVGDPEIMKRLQTMSLEEKDGRPIGVKVEEETPDMYGDVRLHSASSDTLGSEKALVSLTGHVATAFQGDDGRQIIRFGDLGIVFSHAINDNVSDYSFSEKTRALLDGADVVMTQETKNGICKKLLSYQEADVMLDSILSEKFIAESSGEHPLRPKYLEDERRAEEAKLINRAKNKTKGAVTTARNLVKKVLPTGPVHPS